METETQEIVTAKQLINFIGLPCLIYDGGKPVPHPRIEGVDIDTNEVIAERTNYKPIQIKPILKKLEDIRLKDVIHYSCDIMGYDRETEEEQIKWFQNDLHQIREFGMIQFDTKDSIYLPKVFQYLTEQGYDLGLLPHGSYLIMDNDGNIENLNDFDEQGNLITLKKN